MSKPRSISLLATVIAAAALAAPAAASPIPRAPTADGTGRVAVAPFSGPEPLSGEVRAVVAAIIDAHHQLVTAGEVERARSISNVGDGERSEALAIARLTRADAVVVGRVGLVGDGYALSLSLLRPDPEETLGAFLVPLEGDEVTPSDRTRIARLLGNLLAFLQRPGDGAAGQPMPGSPPGAAPPGTAAPDPAPGPPPGAAPPAINSGAPSVSGAAKAASPTPAAGTRRASREEPVIPPWRQWRVPLGLSIGGGLSVTSRHLSLSQERGLDADASLATNLSPGVRVEAEAATLGEPGVSLAVAVDRSIGAGVKLGGADGMELPLTQTQWSAGLRGRFRVRGRWVPHIAAGYNELRHAFNARPVGLYVPDARYTFLDLGGGVRLELGAVSLFGAASYLHMLSTSGVTDAAAFGAASSRGLAGEGGVDVELTDSITLRAGARYLRITHDFDGSGDLAVALDQDLDQDVLAAADAYVGGYGQVALRF